MSETLLRDGDLLVRSDGALRRITLNRPQALNAITLDMALAMTALLREWESDPEAAAVLLDGAGGRAFCAGGDIRALYDAAKTGDSLPARFWATEYKLMDGLVMGGGVGLSAHAAHRIVTDRSAIAMPEVGIGFFPDVGACFLLARTPGYIGTYLALTGDRIGAADAIHCGLADVYVPADRLGELPSVLAGCRNRAEVRASLEGLSAAPTPARLQNEREWIGACYGADELETIVTRLSACHAKAATFKNVEESFQQDYRVALACIAGHDFREGIRATIIDKDRNPRWRPDKIEAVTPDIVDRHFRSVGKLELKFES